MRFSLAFTGIAALALAGCGGMKEGPDGPDSTSTSSANGASTYDVAEAPSSMATRGPGNAPPAISPDAAPDVAFAYRYNFGLAGDRIATVQQRHASLCEEMGAARCRITGMTYSGRDNDVRADLNLAVEPGLAHRFGEQAMASVREAEGRLIDSQVTGRDVGSGIRGATRTIAQLEERLAELEAQIARGGSVGTIRDLNHEAAGIRSQLQSLRGTRGEAREELATTPVILSYRSGAYAVGAPDFGGALASAWDQAKWLAYGLFMILVMLSPWLVGAGLIWLGVRALRRRRAATEAPSA